MYDETIEQDEPMLPWKGGAEQRTYTVLYEQGPTSWGAYVPDLEGCIATGKTRQEVERRIQEALEVHVRGMARSGEKVPAPTIFPGQVTLQVPIATAEDQVAA